VFAPDPARAGEEDGGWLLNIVTDRVTERSDLVVLDAPTLEEVARVHLAARVPFGFHGNWLAAG
jgi:carotenoid cleavage dioxygenase